MKIFANIVRWLDGLMRLPAWADPWPAGLRVAAKGCGMQGRLWSAVSRSAAIALH
jgi:hypothetical protein